MLGKLIQFALTQRLLLLILTIAIAAAGAFAYQSLPIDAFPDVSSAQVKIIVKAPGMTLEEVEARITAPIEVEMLGIPKQVGLRSVAKYALTDITVDFMDGTDIYWARQQVAERLNSVWGNLPPDVSGGMAVFQAEVGQATLGTTFGGAGEQVVQVFGAQGDGLRHTGFVYVLHGWVSKMQNARTGCLQAGANNGSLLQAK